MGSAVRDLDAFIHACMVDPACATILQFHRFAAYSVFEDETVAELLTTGKLSELACLTLYMMYEKLRGKDSRWYEFIKVRNQLAKKTFMSLQWPMPTLSRKVTLWNG